MSGNTIYDSKKNPKDVENKIKNINTVFSYQTSNRKLNAMLNLMTIYNMDKRPTAKQLLENELLL